MPLPFAMPNPARQLTTLINQGGEAVPIEMIIREAVFNGFDSNARFKHNNPDYEGESYILIGKDFEFKNKVRVTNVGGDYFSEEIAQKNFLTLANSIDQNENVNLDYDETKGRGAKIAYLPHAPEGIYYRSKKDDSEGVSFHAKLQPEGIYGLSDFEDPEIGITNFPDCGVFNSELSNSMGTDMVLMGGSQEQDTWNFLHHACGKQKATKSSDSIGTGWNYVIYISNRLWGPPPCPVKIEIYKQNDTCGQPTRMFTHRANCTDLKTQMSLRKTKGCFTLPDTNGVIKGTKVYYTLMEDTDRGTYWTTSRGFVGFAYKGEVYYDKNKDHNSDRADLRNCGIYTKSSKWLIIFEIPSAVKLYSAADRTFLKDIDKNCYFDCLKDNLPDEIKEFLENNTQTDINESDLNKWLRDELKCFRLPQQDNKGKKDDDAKDLPDLKIVDNDFSQEDPPVDEEKPKRRKKEKASHAKLKCAEVPEIVYIDDEESEMCTFSFKEYKLFLNLGHHVYKYRLNKFVSEFDRITEKEISNLVIRSQLKCILYRIFEVQQIYTDESISQKQRRWEPQILESLWSKDTETRIATNLKRKQSYRSAS